MLDEKQIVQVLMALSGGYELAGRKSEGFVLAITAAYMAGIEAGKLAATGAA